MKKYPKYKQTNIDWIGEIPEHWTIKRLGFMFGERSKKVSDFDYTPLSVTKRGVVPQLENAAKTKNHGDRKLVKQNDFVINARSDRRGSSGISKYEGSVSVAYTVLKGDSNFNMEYFHYLFRSTPFTDEFYRFGKGIVADLWSTRFTDMRNIMIPLFDKQEQTLIASFFDHKTALIDDLIFKNEKQIKLLKEKCKATINQAVTKGLDSNVKMKDSGVEWIGEIPEHWEVKKLKWMGKFYGGLSGKSGKDFNNDENINNKPYIPFTNIFNNMYINTENFHQVLIDSSEKQNRVQRDDLFFLMSSEGYEDLGKCAILLKNVEELYLNSFCRGFRISDKLIEGRFVNYLLNGNTHRKLIEVEGRGFTRINLRLERLKMIPAILPPKSEQTAIATYLDQETAKIDKLINKIKKQNALLSEYRQSLISHVVTGKVDVRDEIKNIKSKSK